MTLLVAVFTFSPTFSLTFSLKFFLTFFLPFSLNASVPLKSQIQKLTEASGLPKEALSIIVGASSSKIEYQWLAEKSRVPASLTKIVTAAQILQMRNAARPVATRLLSSAAIVDRQLHGDLVLQGGGDPAFVSENMWYLVNEFRRTGVELITGDLVVDDFIFDDIRFDESRRQGRVDRAYDSPVGAMSFNWNVVNVYVRPTKAGQPAQVLIDPQTDYLQVKGKILTSPSGGRSNMTVRRLSENSKDVVVVSGKIAADSPEKVFYRSISDPAIWSGHALKSFLKQRGITVAGGIRRGKVSEKTVELAASVAKPIDQIVRDMQKFSNNFVAEMLVKLVSSWSHRPGSMTHGTRVLNESLQDYGWAKDSFNYFNPSGLSRKNKFTAKQIFQVLERSKKVLNYGPEFLTALPLSGVDGTLKNRLKESDVVGKVRAKTGYLSGVVGLAGYAETPSDQFRIFAMIYNGPSKWDAKARNLFDKLASLLTK